MLKARWKKVIVILFAALLAAILLAVLLQVGFGGRYTDRDGKYVHVTTASSFSHISKHPLWQGNGKNLFPVWGDSKISNLSGFMSVRSLCFWCGWNAESAIDGVNYLIDRANEGTIPIWNVYSDEEIQADPHLAAAQAVYYEGQPGMPVAIVAAGGGYNSVASLVEAYPYAAVLNRAGYSVFVLKYRVADDLIPADDVADAINPKVSEASKDMQALIRLIDRRSEELGVSLEGYSLWGSSAGGGLITAFAFEHEGKSFEELGIPRPAALMLIYTHAKYIDQFSFSEKDPPVFTIVGVGDAYGGDTIMDAVVPRMRDAGMDVVYHKYENYPHGCGLGIGTDGEGWIEEAIGFWESRR